MTRIRYDRGTGPLKGWLVEETAFDADTQRKFESIFTQGNGYLGLRCALEEEIVGQSRGLFVAGTFDRAEENEVTELPNFPDFTNMQIRINGYRFTLTEGTVEHYSRVLNLYTGEVTRDVVWAAPGGERVRFRFCRTVSLADVHLIAARAEITPLSADCTVDILSGIDGTVTNTGSQHFLELSKRILSGDVLEYTAQARQSQVAACLHTRHVFLLNGEPISPVRTPRNTRRAVHLQFTISVGRGQTLAVEKLSTVHTSWDAEYAGLHRDEVAASLPEDSRRVFAETAALTYTNVRERSADRWASYWQEQDIEIEAGDIFDQLAVRFALYHMNIMVCRGDSRRGIAAKGLSGEGYRGHSFWDTETFVLPYFLMTQPETARTLLEYRYRGLEAARRKAREYGYSGAMFPWEAALPEDGEVCPTYLGVDIVTGEALWCRGGSMELHITCDIAYAVWQYWLTTGDRDFMRRYGDELLVETARFWVSRLEWKESAGRYELTHVIGPDEFKEDIDNDAYTNYMVRHNLELATGVLERLLIGSEPLPPWAGGEADARALLHRLQAVSRGLYLPGPDERTGIIPQFDGYGELQELDLRKYKESLVANSIYRDYTNEQLRRYKISKQADVVQLFHQLGDRFSREVLERNFVFYEEHTTHDSSLSCAIHSVLALELGLGELGYALFRRAASTDLGQNPYSSDEGIHAANMGGIWQDAVMGFGGLQLRGERPVIQPHLPAVWKSLRYRFRWHGSRVDVRLTHESMAIRCEDEELPCIVEGLERTIKAGETAVISYKESKQWGNTAQ